MERMPKKSRTTSSIHDHILTTDMHTIKNIISNNTRRSLIETINKVIMTHTMKKLRSIVATIVKMPIGTTITITAKGIIMISMSNMKRTNTSHITMMIVIRIIIIIRRTTTKTMLIKK